MCKASLFVLLNFGLYFGRSKGTTNDGHEDENESKAKQAAAEEREHENETTRQSKKRQSRDERAM